METENNAEWYALDSEDEALAQLYDLARAANDCPIFTFKAPVQSIGTDYRDDEPCNLPYGYYCTECGGYQCHALDDTRAITDSVRGDYCPDCRLDFYMVLLACGCGAYYWYHYTNVVYCDTCGGQ